MTTLKFGVPVRVVLDGQERRGEFAGLADRRQGRVRIGHRVRTVPLTDIREIVAPNGDVWAERHAVRP